MIPVALDPPPELAGYNCWYVPARGIRILIPAELVGNMQADVLSAGHSHVLAGILVGTVLPEPEAPAIVIDGVQYIRWGDPALELPRTLPNAKPLGYFRRDAGDLTLEAADVAFLQQHFPDAGSVALLVRPYPVGICMAALFFRGADGSIPRFSDLETSFIPHRSPLRSSSPPTPTVEDAAPDLFHFAQASSSPLRSVRLAAAALLMTAVAMSSIAYLWRGTPPTSPSHTDKLGMHLQTTAGGKVVLRWNRDNAVLLQATRGLLSIQDGPSHRQIPIGSGELRSGSVVYFRSPAAVEFRLDVHLNNGSLLSETLHLPEASPTPPRPD